MNNNMPLLTTMESEEIARLRGEAKVLRDIMRDLLAVVDEIYYESPEDWEHMLDLRTKARAAITGVPV